MSKKSSNFFEEHIEKMILGLVGLACIWLLITRVFISPNVVSYDNKKWGCGDIDTYISEQSERLRGKLDRNPEPKEAYNPRIEEFSALIDLAISGVEVNTVPLAPGYMKEEGIQPEYDLPSIGGVVDVGVEHIRAVAYVPIEDVDEENMYNDVVNEPNDLDFVTVEAKFDVAELYNSFYESFAGENVQREWRDPCLAEPVFAAVELQRQEQLADGSWSDWQFVPRTKVDHRKKRFEIVEKVERLPAGGMKVRLLQFADIWMQKDLLQPGVYQLASAEEEWLPPSLYKKFMRLQNDLQLYERRETRASEQEERERERERERGRLERSSRLAEMRRRSTRIDDEGVGSEDFGDESVFLGRGSTARRGRGDRRIVDRGRAERSRSREVTKAINEVYKEFDEISIFEETNFSKMREPLWFWAHDDTVEAGKSYRYRIRAGVFNPVAGTNKISEKDRDKKNKVVLWGGFSDVTKVVKIPEMLYFFPTEIQEALETVKIQVSRYVLGYWYSEEFPVKQGEVIGKVIRTEFVEAEEDITVPETIDYSTGAVLVDVVPVNDWSEGKNLRPRRYYEMLYSFDETNMHRVPIRARYWAEELHSKFLEIKKSEKEPKKPWRPWSGRARERGRRPAIGIEEVYDEFEEEYFMSP